MNFSAYLICHGNTNKIATLALQNNIYIYIYIYITKVKKKKIGKQIQINKKGGLSMLALVRRNKGGHTTQIKDLFAN